MCQLILCNLRDKVLNQIFMSALIQMDAAAGNRDGTGIMTAVKGEARMWKTALSGDGIINLGAMITDRITNANPAAAHVRAASKGIQVTSENAHPFKGTRFALSHNGRLYNSGDKVSWNDSKDDTSLASDSKLFLDEMEKENQETPGQSIVAILNKCMERHMGKFAFIIYDNAVSKFYVVRGESADLHKMCIYTRVSDDESKDVLVGYLVNTRKDSLDDAVTFATQVAQIVGKGYIVGSKIELLDKNTIYEVGSNDLIKVGEVKENPVVYASFSNSNSAWTGGGATSNATSKHSYEVSLSNPIVRLADRIFEFARDHFLSIDDLDNLFYIFTGVPMCRIGHDDMKLFVDEVIPKLSAPKTIRDEIMKQVRHNGKIYPSAYRNIPDFEFPWMCNTPEKLQLLVNELKEINKAAG